MLVEHRLQKYVTNTMELSSREADQKITCHFGIQMFIVLFMRAHHCTLSQDS